MPYRIGAVRHGDMDQLAAPVEESVQLRSGLMTENGIRARPDERRPEFGRPRRSAGESAIDTPLQALPPAAAQQVLHSLRRQASFAGLVAAQDASLIAEESPARHGKFN